jgi:hypothetical protein
MNELNASLETSKQTPQANSQSANNGAPDSKGAPNNQTQQPPKPQSLAEMFGDKSDESSLEISLDDDSPDDPNAPLDSIERLKKRNKLTDEQVYKIKVPMPNGAEALSIGELKDKITDLTDFEMRQVEFDERRIKKEGELLKSEGELRDILGMLPKEALDPKVLGKIHERQQSVTRREKALTIEHIPSWSDEKSRNKDLELMQETLGDYGFDESFLHSVIDHRAMKFIRDMCLMRARIRKSIADVRDPQRLNGRPSGKTQKAAIRPNTNSPRKKMATQDDKLRQIFQE